MTADQIKKRFLKEGKTLADFARKNGFKANDVTRVLNGQLKGTRGKAHEIAIALGLKKAA